MDGEACVNFRTLPEMKAIAHYFKSISFDKQKPGCYQSDEIVRSLEHIISLYEEAFAAMQMACDEEVRYAYNQGREAARVEFSEEKKRLRAEVERIIAQRVKQANLQQEAQDTSETQMTQEDQEMHPVDV